LKNALLLVLLGGPAPDTVSCENTFRQQLRQAIWGGFVLKVFRLIFTLPIGLWALLVLATPAFAQSAAPDMAVDFIDLLPNALILLMPLGLILLISSAVSEDRAPAVAINLLAVWALAALAYFGAGFAFQFGGIAQVSPRPDLSGLYWEWYPLDQSVDVDVARLWGVIALRGWALTGEAATPGSLALFLSNVSLVGVAAMIPAGVLVQRTRGIVAMLTGLLVGLFIYPVSGNWLWGGGWLSNLGHSLGLGHGLVDLGGASVIFLSAGAIALVALILFRRPRKETPTADADREVVVVSGSGGRLTVYDEPAASVEAASPLSSTPMPSAYLPILGLLGAGLMLVGWFGVSTGVQAPTALNFSPALAAVNGLLAALAGALAAGSYSWFTTQALNPLMTARGLVAGLIVVSAGAPFMPIWICLIAGLLVGLLLAPLIYLLNQGWQLADESGTVATYGVSAVVGLLLVAFFADGLAGQGWNGVGLVTYLGVPGQGVSGLVVASGFAVDWPDQLQAQLLGLGVISLWAVLLSFLLFQIARAVGEAWARSGLELAEPTRAPVVPVRPDSDEPADEQVDSQATISNLN
jgi:Amt family ammonium transporter